MFNLGFTEMIILAVIVLVFVGPNELPELARVVGRFLNEFRRSTDALKEEWNRSTEDINPQKFVGELRSDIEQSIGGSAEKLSAPETAESAEPQTEAPGATDGRESPDAPAGPSYPPDGKYER